MAEFHPSDRSETAPVLSYQSHRQPQMVEVDWSVRFFAIWMICQSSVPPLRAILEITLSSSALWLYQYSPVLFLVDLISIAFGVIAFRQKRYGFAGLLGTLAASLLLRFYSLRLDRFSTAAVAGAAAALPALAALAMTVSVRRRADAAGSLYPARSDRPGTPSHANGPLHLVPGLGWIYVARCFSVILLIAMPPLLARAGIRVAPYTWQQALLTTTYLAVGIPGVLLCCSRLWAVWPLVALHFCQVASQWIEVVPRMYNGVPFTSVAPNLISSSLAAITSAVLLCILASKAASAQPTPDR